MTTQGDREAAMAIVTREGDLLLYGRLDLLVDSLSICASPP